MSDHWYYRLIGEEFGPVPFEILSDLARNGDLNSNDEVRRSTADSWVPAGSIRQLFPMDLHSPGNADSDAAEEIHSLSELNISIARSESTCREDTPSHGSSSTGSETRSASTTEHWYCRTLTQELGPLSRQDLRCMLERKEIADGDLLKLGSNGEWRLARSLVAQSPELRLGSTGNLPSPEVHKERMRRNGADPLFEKTGQTTVHAAQTVSADGGPFDLHTLLRMPIDRTLDFVDGLRFRIQSHTWILFVPFALALLVVAGYFAIASIMTDREIYRTFQTIATERKALRSANATDAEWSDFVAKANAQIKPLMKHLEKKADLSHPGRKHLLWAGHDCLPKMLKNRRIERNRAEQQFDQHMAEAKSFLHMEK